MLPFDQVTDRLTWQFRGLSSRVAASSTLPFWARRESPRLSRRFEPHFECVAFNSGFHHCMLATRIFFTCSAGCCVQLLSPQSTTLQTTKSHEY
jgi:hypothetical protein